MPKRTRTDLADVGEGYCSAHTSAGNPCRRRPIKGGSVCASHGGRAPQVKRKAAERIVMAADAAAANLIKWMNDEAVPYNIRLAAARDLLDRAAVTEKTLTVEVRPFEQNLAGLFVDVHQGDDGFVPTVVRGEVEARSDDPW